jgi:two-component system chemotaxis response regulator CheY
MPFSADVQVLIVDDQRSMRTLVRGCLVELGFKDIHECADGVEALQYLVTRPSHLVISDMHMPRLDGLALLRRVRETPELKTTAFIMLTSVGEVEQVKAAVALGVNNYLVKPFTLATLRRKIEAVFGPLQ